MAARAIWKGVIRFGGLDVPVKLYSGVEDRKVHFRLLHEPDLVPLQQRMVNPDTGDVVERDVVRKGYEPEPGTFVVLDADDQAEIEPTPSRDIEITRFVPPDRITPAWYERPYYLGPDGDGDAYFALARALGDRDREGVARWVMRKKRYIGALRVEDGYLLLVTLRFAGEVVNPEQLPAPRGRDLSERELGMAEQLVSALEDEFRPGEYHDEYRERVLELVAAKAAGKKAPVVRLAPRREEPESLDRALAASLERAKKERRSA
ncbi:MAG TPA: Ku protein [Thermoanaerobaculia bacterium]|nr:Ku protein [Thermoanaerobaculia bacterium]